MCVHSFIHPFISVVNACHDQLVQHHIHSFFLSLFVGVNSSTFFCFWCRLLSYIHYKYIPINLSYRCSSKRRRMQNLGYTINSSSRMAKWTLISVFTATRTIVESAWHTRTPTTTVPSSINTWGTCRRLLVALMRLGRMSIGGR